MSRATSCLKAGAMRVQPDYDMSNYRAAGKLTDKVALIAGANSGIGQAVAITFAMEGADIAVLYNKNNSNAEVTRQHIEKHGRRCHLIKIDVGIKSQCEAADAQSAMRSALANPKN